MRWCDRTTSSLPSFTQRKVKPTACKCSRLLSKSINVAQTTIRSPPQPDPPNNLPPSRWRSKWPHANQIPLANRSTQTAKLFDEAKEAGSRMKGDSYRACDRLQQRSHERIKGVPLLLGRFLADGNCGHVSTSQTSCNLNLDHLSPEPPHGLCS